MNNIELTERQKFILYVLGLIDDGIISPIQVQKLLFLIEKKIPNIVNGFFNFEPYDYGPFDKVIYEELEYLKNAGFIQDVYIDNVKHSKIKSKIDVGIQIPSETLERIKKISQFVKECTFKELLVAIYNAYPEMAVNTVFKGWKK